MSDIQSYAKEYLNEKRKFNRPSTEFKFYSEIKSKEDVDNLYNDASNVLNRANKIYPLDDYDMENLSNAIIMYETAVRKAMTMMKNSFTKWEYNLSELQQHAIQLDELIKSFKDLYTRKLNQD